MSSALRLELRRSRSLVLWVGLVSALYAGGITVFYPTVLENAAEFEKMLQIYPKELMAAFGLSGSLGDPGMFFNSYIFQFLWPLVAAIVAILMATRPAADAERGFLELPLSTRLSRLRYLTATIVAQVIAMAVLAAVTILAVSLVDLVIEPDFAIDRLVLGGMHAMAMGLAVAGVTTALAVALLDRGTGRWRRGRHPHRDVPGERHRQALTGSGLAGRPVRVPLLRPQAAHRLGPIPDRGLGPVPARRDHRLAARRSGVPATRPGRVDRRATQRPTDRTIGGRFLPIMPGGMVGSEAEARPRASGRRARGGTRQSGCPGPAAESRCACLASSGPVRRVDEPVDAYLADREPERGHRDASRPGRRVPAGDGPISRGEGVPAPRTVGRRPGPSRRAGSGARPVRRAAPPRPPPGSPG